MIDLAFVESLIRALDESSLDSLELERGATRIRLSKTPTAVIGAPQNFGHAVHGTSVTHHPGGMAPSMAPGHELPAAPAPEVEGDDLEGLIEVTSPMVGTFYSSPAPDADPYVQVGQRIGEGTVLCIIEAMKLMNELESEVSGEVVEILVENGTPVEFGQVLMRVKPG